MAAKALTSSEPYPTGPRADGTLLIDNDTGQIFFWDATTNQWRAILR